MRSRFEILRNRFRDPVVLDFGSGAVYFCRAAQESGLDTYGLELSDKLSEFSKSNVKFYKIFKSLGSTPFSRTVELRVALPVAACRVSVSDVDCEIAQCSQRYQLWLRLVSGSAGDSPVRV
jgi:hypothetical protein